MTQDSDKKPSIERRSGKERRSPIPRRKEHRWEPHKPPRRQQADRRKENIYSKEMDTD